MALHGEKGKGGRLVALAHKTEISAFSITLTNTKISRAFYEKFFFETAIAIRYCVIIINEKKMKW